MQKNNSFLNKIIEQFKEKKVIKLYKAYFAEENNLNFKNFYSFKCIHNKHYFGYQNSCVCDSRIYEKIVLNMKKGKKKTIICDKEGKETLTYIKKNNNYYDCIPITGHNHQIRVLMHFFHKPILGDKLYNKDYKNHHKLQLFSYLIAFDL